MPDAVRRLTPAGRGIRVGVGLVAAAALLLGSWQGSDDDFPFGPFLMFAGRNPPTEDVPSTFLQAVTSTGQLVTVGPDVTGYRRAELEGQLGDFETHTARLRDVAVAHARIAPGAPGYVVVRVVQRRYHLRARHIAGATDVVRAQWRAR